MTKQQETTYYKYSDWALSIGADISIVEVNEDGDVFIRQENEDGFKMIAVPAEFEAISLIA